MQSTADRLREFERRETLLNRVKQRLLARSTQESRKRAEALEELLEEALTRTQENSGVDGSAWPVIRQSSNLPE